MIFTLLALLVLGLFAWWICKEAKQEKQKQLEMEKIQQARDKAKIAKIEEGLREWLVMLELSQFADQKKLQEATRQLRIVLVEQLLNWPSVD
ncbi:MAG: hypothetical protein HOP06_04800 [Methylotenera sp.]|nr:hypothetical protein [Methylotenera sp.]